MLLGAFCNTVKNMDNRWQIPKDKDAYWKVLKVQKYIQERTVSKTILYMIDYAYEKMFEKK